MFLPGFNCDGVVNTNVVELLEDAIARRNDIKILVCAILNDTTGTLMCKYHAFEANVILS